MWKKITLLFCGMLIGCASAVGISAVSAQGAPVSLTDQRYQLCQDINLTVGAADLDRVVREREVEGFELVDVEYSPVGSAGVACFKRLIR